MLDQRIATNSEGRLTASIVVDNHNDVIEESSTITHYMVTVKISTAAIPQETDALVSGVDGSAVAIGDSPTIADATTIQPVVAVAPINDVPMEGATEEAPNEPQS